MAGNGSAGFHRGILLLVGEWTVKPGVREWTGIEIRGFEACFYGVVCNGGNGGNGILPMFKREDFPKPARDGLNGFR